MSGRRTADPLSVLIADDQADVRLALRLLAKGANIQAEEAASPAEVLAALRRRRFDRWPWKPCGAGRPISC